MTISSTVTSVQPLGNGVATAFQFPNKVFANTDLVVTLIDTLGNLYPFVNFANATLGLSYVVNNVDVDQGCSVVFSAPPAVGWTVDIRSATPDTQSTSIKNQGSFFPELHEEAFDRATRMIQDLLRQTYTYGIHGPDIETVPWSSLPNAAGRKGMALVFDAVQGLPTVGLPVTGTLTAQQLAIVGTDSGAANAYIVTHSGPIAITKTVGALVRFIAQAANTGPATANVDGTGATAIVGTAGNALAGGEIQTTAFSWLQWTGTAWQLVGNGVAPTFIRTPAEITAGATVVNGWYGEGHLYRYGTNTTPGTTDMTAALNAAISVIGAAVFIPPHDTILIASNPNQPVCAQIYGAGKFSSILTAGPSVTKLLSLIGSIVLHDFQILGNATASAVGIVFGDNANMNEMAWEVLVKNFTGTNAIGMKFGQCVKMTFINCITFGCTRGTVCDASAMTNVNCPVNSTWINHVSTNSSDVNVVIVTSQGCRWLTCDSESATHEGWLIQPAVNINIHDLVFDQCWSEANYSAGNFMMTFDGSAAGCILRATVRDCRWTTGGGTAFAMQTKGAHCYVTLEGGDFASVLAGNITIQNTTGGFFVNRWNEFYSYAGSISDTGHIAWGWPITSQTWAPTIASVGGGSSLSAIVVTVANFRRITGNLIWVEVVWSATVSGGAASYMSITPPPSTTLATASVRLPANVTDNGAEVGGALLVDTGGNVIRQYKLNGAAYNATGTVGGTWQAILEG